MENHVNKRLASKLYVLRRQANRKQSDLAERLQISQQAYSKLEMGATRFNERIIETLCACFNISRQEFMDGEAAEMMEKPEPFSGGHESEIIPARLPLMLMEEIAKMREERAMLIKLIISNMNECKREQAVFLDRISEMLKKSVPFI